MISNLKNFIPRPLWDYGLWNNFYTFLNNQYTYYLSKAKGIREEFISVQTTNPVELANTVGAYHTDDDSIDDIRIKTGNAFKTHKNLPSFSNVYKPIIDKITGGNSSIYTGQLYFGSFIVGQSIIGSPALIGNVTFPNGVSQNTQKGVVYIDLGTTPTTDQTERIIKQLRELIPVYFLVYIGTTTTIISGTFLVGSSAIGGYDTIGGGAGTFIIFNTIARII